jgi:hypothetical protein
MDFYNAELDSHLRAITLDEEAYCPTEIGHVINTVQGLLNSFNPSRS